MYILAVAYAIGLYFTDKESELYHQSNNRLLYLKISQLSVLAFGSFPLLFYMGETGMACAVLLSRLSGWVYLITMCKNEQKNEITLWGYYGFNNLGDDVMLDVCLKEIKSTKNMKL